MTVCRQAYKLARPTADYRDEWRMVAPSLGSILDIFL